MDSGETDEVVEIFCFPPHPPTVKLAHWYYKNEILLAVSWKLGLIVFAIFKGEGEGMKVKTQRELKKNSGIGQKILFHPMKKRRYYFQFADCCWFQEQPVLEEEAAFPSHDSLDLTSSGESGCEESQEQLLGAGQPRLLADCSLLFLLCNLPRRVNVLEEWDEDQGARGAESMFWGANESGEEEWRCLSSHLIMYQLQGALWIISEMYWSSSMNSYTNWE